MAIGLCEVICSCFKSKKEKFLILDCVRIYQKGSGGAKEITGCILQKEGKLFKVVKLIDKLGIEYGDYDHRKALGLRLIV